MLPLLTVLLFGGIEFGHFMWTEHQVIKAVRDGARYAGRQNFNSFDCASVTDTDVQTRIQRLTRTGFPTGDNPEITGTNNPHVRDWTSDTTVAITVDCITGENFSGAGLYKDFTQNDVDEFGNPVTEGIAKKVIVSAEVPYPPLFGGFGFLDFFDGYKLKATAESPVMGF